MKADAKKVTKENPVKAKTESKVMGLGHLLAED